MTKWSSDTVLVASQPSQEVIEEAALAMAQATIYGAMEASKTKRADLADRMGRPRSFISRMLKGDHNLTIKTFARAVAGCGYELRFTYVPIESTSITTILDKPIGSSPVKCSEANNSNFALAA